MGVVLAAWLARPLIQTLDILKRTFIFGARGNTQKAGASVFESAGFVAR